MARSDQLPKGIFYILQSWDTAFKSGEMNSYTVCTTWSLSGANFYLMDVRRERLTYPQLKRAASGSWNWSAWHCLCRKGRDSSTMFWAIMR